MKSQLVSCPQPWHKDRGSGPKRYRVDIDSEGPWRIVCIYPRASSEYEIGTTTHYRKRSPTMERTLWHRGRRLSPTAKAILDMVHKELKP